MTEAADQLRIPKAAELMARELRRRIVVGDLPEGAPLPPEDELMAQFGLARTTIREAFRVLESEGLLVIRRGAGGGARVRAPSVSAVARYAGLVLQFEGATLADVHEAWISLEAPVAGWLARHRDDESMLEALRRALAEEAAVASDPAQLASAEGRFHQALVRLAGSEALDMLIGTVHRIIARHAERLLTSSEPPARTRADHQEAHRAHERLVALISVGAADEAEAFWRKHLEAGAARMLKTAGASTVLDLSD